MMETQRKELTDTPVYIYILEYLVVLTMLLCQ